MYKYGIFQIIYLINTHFIKNQFLFSQAAVHFLNKLLVTLVDNQLSLSHNNAIFIGIHIIARFETCASKSNCEPNIT